MNRNYDSYLRQNEAAFEALCVRCGECCGATDGDPCARLCFDEKSARYYCADYENRLGDQRTVSGKIFTCVTIRELIKTGGLRQKCAYYRFAK